MSVNRVTIVGNMGRDPEIRQTPSGQAVANLSIGTHKSWLQKDGTRKERTSWHKVVAWGALADLCGKVLHKGQKVYIDGELNYEDYKANDGSPRQKAIIKADQIVAMDSGHNREDAGLDPNVSIPAPPPRTDNPSYGWERARDDGDIPF